MSSLSGIVLGTLCLIALTRLVSKYYLKRTPSLPPGPPGLPIIGNARDMPEPSENPWLKYRDWCRKYDSDIIRLNTLGVNIIVIDTLEAANELLDKRSSMYSGRPRMIMLNELSGFRWAFGTMDYNEDWRACRKMTHHEFHATAFPKYRPILLRCAQQLVRRLAKEDGARVPVHLKHMVGANIMEVTYGIKVLPEHDPFVKLAEASQQAVGKCAIGFYLVEILPILKHIPAWFPGAGFKRQAAVWHEAATRHLNVPYADFAERNAFGKAEDCMAKALAETFGTDPDAVRLAKMSAATMYMGGAETVRDSVAQKLAVMLTGPKAAAILHSFFMVMTLYPEVQSRARRELEGVLGTKRLPTFEDCGSVPYIEAFIKELLRWHPIVCLGLPHKLREDDVYKGYHIEKDSMVIVNVWSILHDETVYTNPETFNPERFLKDGQLDSEILDPEHVAFGFGRRICPGKYMAYDTLWITIATVLITTEIGLTKDSNGRDIPVKEDYVGAFVTEPRPFPCSVRYRSDKFREMLS